LVSELTVKQVNAAEIKRYFERIELRAAFHGGKGRDMFVRSRSNISRFERLKAIAIVESPLRFRIRKIFVCENSLSRV
jgi:hypothetical protein